jgi:hypothetical protein
MFSNFQQSAEPRATTKPKGMQLGYFASYIFLFSLDIAAWRHDWLQQLEWKHARDWIIALVIAWPCMPVGR